MHTVLIMVYKRSRKGTEAYVFNTIRYIRLVPLVLPCTKGTSLIYPVVWLQKPKFRAQRKRETEKQ